MIINKMKKMTLCGSKKNMKIITSKGKIAHVLDDPNAYERAILDVELLSRCDRLIITGGSTFGLVAAFKSGRRPYFIDGQQGMKKCSEFSFWAPSRRPTGHAVF